MLTYPENNDNRNKEIIKTLMATKFKDDMKHYDQNLEDLQSMSTDKLDEMLGNYYLYEIKK